MILIQKFNNVVIYIIINSILDIFWLEIKIFHGGGSY